MLQTLTGCLVKTSKFRGVNREQSQAAFYDMAKDGFPKLTHLTKKPQLSSWIAVRVFRQMVDRIYDSQDTKGVKVGLIQEVEKDIAHYIGGCMISKLKKRTKDEDEKNSSGKFRIRGICWGADFT